MRLNLPRNGAALGAFDGTTSTRRPEPVFSPRAHLAEWRRYVQANQAAHADYMVRAERWAR